MTKKNQRLDAQIRLTPPPENTEEELGEVIDQYFNRVVPNTLQDDMDRNVEGLFDKIILKEARKSILEDIVSIARSIEPDITFYKKLYNRKRPSEYAKSIGLEWTGDDHNMGTTDTASYPSGHTCQAYYIALNLSDIYEDLEDQFMSLAEDVAQSRVDRGVHYPSDLDGGVELAIKVYNSEK